MIRVDAYKSYYGGKGGDGTYQTLINFIPPHQLFMSLCLGNCAVTRHIKPARFNVLNDLDINVVASWKKALPEAIAEKSDVAGSLDELFDVGHGHLLMNRTACDILASAPNNERCDTGDTFILLDPPYLIDSRKSLAPVYRCEMTRIDHELLLSSVVRLKNARVMLCAYPNGLYDGVLTGWYTHDYFSKTRNGVALERLYMNYQVGDELHDYSFIGSNFREREQNNRIKNNFLDKLNRMSPRLRNSILSDLASQKD